MQYILPVIDFLIKAIKSRYFLPLLIFVVCAFICFMMKDLYEQRLQDNNYHWEREMSLLSKLKDNEITYIRKTDSLSKEIHQSREAYHSLSQRYKISRQNMTNQQEQLATKQKRFLAIIDTLVNHYADVNIHWASFNDPLYYKRKKQCQSYLSQARILARELNIYDNYQEFFRTYTFN